MTVYDSLKKDIDDIISVCDDYVSYEIAKSLTEKGFNSPCKTWYSEYTSSFDGKKHICLEFNDNNRFDSNYKFLCYAPTTHRALKWLRVKHLIQHVIEPCIVDGKIKYTWKVYKVDPNKKGYINLPGVYTESEEDFERYEDAEISIIEFCLKYRV